MENFIIVAVLLIIIGAAVVYIVKAKKSGVKCIGCPHSATCGGKCSGDCSGSCGMCNHNEE